MLYGVFIVLGERAGGSALLDPPYMSSGNFMISVGRIKRSGSGV